MFFIALAFLDFLFSNQKLVLPLIVWHILSKRCVVILEKAEKTGHIKKNDDVPLTFMQHKNT